MRREVRGWFAYGAAWLPLALLYGVAVATQPNGSTLAQGVASGIVIMGVAALAGVLVWRLSGRVPYPGRITIRFVGLHGAAALVYSAIWLGTILLWLVLVASPNLARDVLRQAGLWQFTTGLYVYTLIAGVSYLLRTQKQLRERETAAARAQTAAAHAQLEAVRAQLNPHFLFNALHAVSSLVRTNPEAADRAIERLGSLLRRALDHTNRDDIPFAEEWSFVREYLELEQLRLGQRLRLDWVIDPDALDVRVPPLVLQPLVENAVQHGIAPRAQGGTVRITAARRNGTLIVRVRDDGPGAERAALLRGGGLGLEVVRRQVQARYGAAGRVEIDTAEEQGFTVTLSLPIAADGQPQ